MSARWLDMDDPEIAGEMIQETEREIANEAFPGGNLLDDDPDAADDLVSDMSQMHSWDGNVASDAMLSREATGEVGPGMSGTDDQYAAVEQLSAENRALREHLGALQEQLPQPQKPDMFVDPEGYEQWLIDHVRGGGTGQRNYGPSPEAKPDMFADPDRYEEWLIRETNRRSGIDQYHEDRLNASMRAAHREFGGEFEEAFDMIRSLDPRRPDHRQLVQSVMAAPDPGRAALAAAQNIRAANDGAMRYGSSHPFAPGLVRQRAPLRNSEGMPPRNAEEAAELEIFNDAAGFDPWRGFR
jgi:hypothetical protein